MGFSVPLRQWLANDLFGFCKERVLSGQMMAVFEERTRWALQLKSEAEAEAVAAAELRAQLRAVADSRWIKLGNRLGLGPKLKATTSDR